jgi:hypothetical protein
LASCSPTRRRSPSSTTTQPGPPCSSGRTAESGPPSASHDDDRELYERTKRELATRQWQFVQNYADAKTTVVEEIIAGAGLPAGTA